MSSASSSSSSSAANGPQILRSFFTADDCAQLIAFGAASNLSFKWPSVGHVCVAVAAVDDVWQFANKLRLAAAENKPFFFVRLSDAAPDDNDGLSDNVLCVDDQGAHSYLNCNVGDAVVARDATVLCGVRSAHAAHSEWFALAFPCAEAVHWPYFEELPLLVKQTILAMLDVDTFLAVGCVSRRWREIVDGNSVWHERVLDQFGEQPASTGDVRWRDIYARLATEKREAAAQARFEPARRHFKPHWLLKEWMDTEKVFLERFSGAHVIGAQLVQRGYSWFDCFATLFPIHERFLADITRMYTDFADAHVSPTKNNCLREQSPLALQILFCDWNVRLVSMTLNPLWRESAIDAVLAFRRTEGNIRLFDAALADVAGVPDSAELSLIVFASRVSRYRLLIREMRRPGIGTHPTMDALVALAERALNITFRDLTPLETQCHRLAPKRRLEEFVAVCPAIAQHTWIPLRSRNVHLLLVQCELLVIEEGTRDVVVPLQGATVTLDGAKLLLRTAADNQQHVFKEVSETFIATLRDQIKTLE